LYLPALFVFMSLPILVAGEIIVLTVCVCVCVGKEWDVWGVGLD